MHNDSSWHLIELLRTRQHLQRSIKTARAKYGQNDMLTIRREKALQMVDDIIDDLVPASLLHKLINI